MDTQTKEKLVKQPPRVLNVGQTIRNSLAYVAFSPSLKGQLLQKQAHRVIELLKEN